MAAPETQEFQVVVNDDGTYSLWRIDEPPPLGWRAVGTSGSREACLDDIAARWSVSRRSTGS